MELMELSVESTQQEKQQRQEEKERQRKEEQDEEERREEQQQHHFHVLAVDDSAIDRTLLERLLKVSSYRVTCVDSGDKALEYLGLLDDFDNGSSSSSASSSSSSSASSSSSSSESPQQEGLKVNLIMTDYCMPGMTGYDLLKRVKGSSWKDVPVVVMSSENIPSIISMCLEEGAEEFLVKPVRQSDVEKLQQHLVKSLGLPIGDNLDDRDNNNTKTNINHNNLSKRKAMSPEPPERIPKLKGLAIV